MSEIRKNYLFNDANLIAYYQLEGNSNDSKSTNNGTDTAIAYSVANGIFGGQGAGFNGTTSNVDITHTATLNINGAGSKVSLSAWFNLTAKVGAGARGYIIRKGFDGVNQSNYGLHILGLTGTDSRVDFRVVAGAGRSHYSATSLNINTWYHAVATCNFGDTAPIIYLNGKAESLTLEDASAADYSFPSTTNNVRLGSSSSGADFFNGNIDDAAIFNRILTASEVALLYNNTKGLINNLRPAIFTPGIAR